jgi:hypothetical protein
MTDFFLLLFIFTESHDIYLTNILQKVENIFPYISTQETNSLKRNLESMSSTSHDQELMEEKNEVEPRRSKRTTT